MSRADTAGMTDYSHQSLEAILKDLSNWLIALKEMMTYLENNSQKLVDNGYWEDINGDFKWIFARANRFYATALTEIEEIKEQLSIEVQSNHVTRLNRIGITSHEIYMDWSDVWVNDVKPKQYGNPNFIILENLCNRSGDMAADLLDLSNVADRLKDYIGRKGNLEQAAPSVTNNNVNIVGDVSGTIIVGDDNEV